MAADAAAAAAAAPRPFWYGFQWEPLPFAEWTVWEEFNDDGVVGKSLNETIREQRDKLSKLGTKYIPFLLGLRNNLKRLINDHLAAPHLRVFRVHYERLVREVEERIVELENKTDLLEFESNIQPYILAHAAVHTHPGSEQHPHDLGTERLASRLLKIIDKEKSGAAHRQQGSMKPEELVRDMISRLWTPHQAPMRKKTTVHDLCQACNIPMTKSVRDQLLVCARCGFSIHFLDTTEAARTYGDDVEFTVNASHRYNHWQEYVTRSQGKELKAVPRSVLAKIVLDLNKNEAIADSDQITMAHVFRSVTRLGINRDYKKNVVQVYSRLSGRWPTQLTTEQMYMCKGMFFEILNAFETLFGNNQELGPAAAAGTGGTRTGGAGGGAGTGAGGAAPSTLSINALAEHLHSTYTALDNQPNVPAPKWFRNKYLMRVICATLGFVWCPPGEDLPELQEEGARFHLAGDLISIQRMKAIFDYLGWTYPEELLSESMGRCALDEEE